MTSKDEYLINSYNAGGWRTARTMPGCSTTEHITVALAIARHGLLPAGYRDPLSAYKDRLDDRQRAIVNLERSW